MTWSSTMPTEPGRYFYREARGYYGMCLVAWSRGMAHGDYVKQPELKIQATCIMGQDDREYGENADHSNWSFGGDLSEPEYWSEPLVTPNFPEISGRPPDIAPAVIKKEKAKSKAQAKESKKRQREQAKARKAAVVAAVKAEAYLYECEDCSSLLLPEDLVVGKLRECPHCCTEFVETDEGRNCPDCNRPFTRLNEEKMTCSDCRDGGELPDLVLIVEGGVIVEQKKARG